LFKIYRQTDTDFISVLNNLRILYADVAALNKYVNLILKENKGITLTTHNAKADANEAQSLQI
jgi:16S rRNA G527 N7-methylase RsmG